MLVFNAFLTVHTTFCFFYLYFFYVCVFVFLYVVCCVCVCVNGPLWTDFQINGIELCSRTDDELNLQTWQ